MPKVVVVARIVAKEGRAEAIERFGREVVAPSHEEAGCEKYALHRDTSDPNVFVLVEVWKSQQDLDEHFGRPHMATIAELADAIEDTTVTFAEPVPYGDPEKGTL